MANLFMKKSLVWMAVVAMAFSVFADEPTTWYVDNTIGKLENGEELYDGKSATVVDGHGPYFKIQNAIDATPRQRRAEQGVLV